MCERYKLSFDVSMGIIDNVGLLLKVIAIKILDNNAENSAPNS
jgi:hypothetical protein